MPEIPATCQATVFTGIGNDFFPPPYKKELAVPSIKVPTDCIIKVVKTTICGTDLHILSGNVATCPVNTRIGHEGIGEVIAVGDAVKKFKVGDRILVSCITGCGKCDYCEDKHYGHCRDGGWLLGNEIDGMQGEFARIPHPDISAHLIPPELHDTVIENQLVLTSDILPTGLETGLLDACGKVNKHITVSKEDITTETFNTDKMNKNLTMCIVGCGPVGLACLSMCVQFYRPKQLFVVDKNVHRLKFAGQIVEDAKKIQKGLDVEMVLVDNANDDAVQQILDKTEGNLGVDLIVECIGVPAAWYICQDAVKPGGHISILGVHGKSATLNLEKMWYRNFTMSAGLVHTYSTPMLMEKIIKKEVDVQNLLSHRMKLSDTTKAYDMFKNAAEHNTLKILLVHDDYCAQQPAFPGKDLM